MWIDSNNFFPIAIGYLAAAKHDGVTLKDVMLKCSDRVISMATHSRVLKCGGGEEGDKPKLAFSENYCCDDRIK